MSGMIAGVAVTRWNQWVEGQGHKGSAILAGVDVGELDCYLDGYRYCLCRNVGELAEEMGQRQSLLESIEVGKPGGNDDEQSRQRVENWRELALGLLPEIYALRGAIESINRRYFDGQIILFPALAEGFDRLLASVEKLVGIYKEDLACRIEHVEKLLDESSDGRQASRLKIDLATVVEKVVGAAKGQVAYLVDMAKADALDLIGETRQAFELADRHV